MLRLKPGGALLLLFAGLLAACGRGAPAPEARALRDPAVQVYSMAGLDPARLTGTWTEVAHIAPPGTPACGPGRLEIRPEGAGLRLKGQLCRGGRAVTLDRSARYLGNGRLLPEGEREAWWVIWADYDNRSIVLATPSGSFASVLDRGVMPPDRRKAARDLLASNGYRTDWLR